MMIMMMMMMYNMSHRVSVVHLVDVVTSVVNRRFLAKRLLRKVLLSVYHSGLSPWCSKL